MVRRSLSETILGGLKRKGEKLRAGFGIKTLMG
jgi:hypothetical protein